MMFVVVASWWGKIRWGRNFEAAFASLKNIGLGASSSVTRLCRGIQIEHSWPPGLEAAHISYTLEHTHICTRRPHININHRFSLETLYEKERESRFEYMSYMSKNLE